MCVYKTIIDQMHMCLSVAVQMLFVLELLSNKVFV